MRAFKDLPMAVMRLEGLSCVKTRTAAAQGRYCVDNGLTISPNDLVPGFSLTIPTGSL